MQQMTSTICLRFGFAQTNRSQKKGSTKLVHRATDVDISLASDLIGVTDPKRGDVYWSRVAASDLTVPLQTIFKAPF